LYYWDNDRLPKSILGKLPKFDIGSRVGENTVKELFFVKIPSTKEYSLENSVPNMNLQRELDAWLHDRLTFIYANSVRNISSQETKKRYSSGLKSLEIIVCTECMFKHEGNNMILKMDNDEIMPLEGKYYLNSNYTSISESMNNPQFWNSLTEIFCLTLKISSEDTYKTIRTILRNDWKFNKLDVDNYLSPEEWENACKDMGISEIEFEFWRKIIGEENFNAKLFKSNKLEYIEEYINVNISDIYDSDTIEFFNMSSDKRIKLYEKLRDCDVNGELFNSYFKNIFIDKYKKSFVELRNNSKNSYTKLLYEDYKDKHDEFLNIANEYMGQWIEDVVFDNKYYSDSEIRSLFEKEVENRFQFSWDGNNIAYSISILPQYINLLAKYNLSEIDLKNNKTMYSLSFFPSHDKELEDWMRSIVPDIQMDVANDIEDDYIVPVIVESKPVQLVKKNTVISNVSNYIGKTKRYVSDGAKSKIGKQSEKLVYNSMIQDSKFIDVIGISKNLDPVNGNDNAHYDITYKESSDLEHLRYLEVKTATYSDGHYSFLMSAYEYEFAKKHIDYYDVALVIDHDIIKIWKSFFKDKSSPSIHTYEVCVNIDND
jgi:hypothetical protein